MEEIKNKETKKKKNFFVRILLGIFWFIVSIILVVLIWLGVNYFIKADTIDSVPSDYSVHLRTDSVWDSVNPLLDLQATDILLADSSFSGVRGILSDFRQSPLRASKLVDCALSRRVDFMLYENNSFVVIINTGILSGAVKLIPFVLNFKPVPNLVVVKADGKTVYEYNTGSSTLYLGIKKNLVIVSSKEDLFAKSQMGGLSGEMKESQKVSFKGKLSSPFAVTADSHKILDMLGKDNAYAKDVAACLPEDEPASVDFGITDHNLKIALGIPYNLEVLDENNPMAAVLKRESKIPGIVQKLPSFIQYYTVINAGSLEELKNAVFHAANPSMNLSGKWETAQNLSKTVFHDSVENLFFSWTGDEFAVLGLEQKSEPVIVLKVRDEKKRREVFDSFFKSIILQNDTSLIMDNVRLPRIEMPPFFQSLVESFGLRIPAPYYTVRDGYLYLSQSPENLAALNAAMKNGIRLSQNENWKEISENFSQETSLSLYYNLERSIPFFVKSKSSVSKILSLYNIGRMDLRIKDKGLEIVLSSVESKTPSSLSFAGFPVETGGKFTSELCKSNLKNSRVVFYAQGNKVVSLNISTQEKNEREIENLKFIVSAAESGKKESGALWAVTSDGTVYFLDEKLKDFSGFPKVTGLLPSSEGSVFKDSLQYSSKGQKLVTVNADSKIRVDNVASFDDIAGAPVYITSGKTVLYERSFMGGFHVVSENEEDLIFPVEGLGFGLPDVMKTMQGYCLGFITQSGLFSLTDISGSSDVLSLQLDGVFYVNVKKCGDSFIALAEDGTLYRIDPNKLDYTRVKIPHLTARSGFITVADFDSDGKEEVFVCGEGNVIYGFRENLEMIGCFPVSGYGRPVFIDADGDKKNECFSLSLDNRLNGCRLVY